MLRTPFASERIQLIDPDTGIRITQVTSYPSPSRHLYYAWPSVTPDNRRLILYVQRSARRDAPIDLFRVDTDGLNLFQLTERPPDCAGLNAVLALDGLTLYAIWGSEQILWAIDVETGEMEQVMDVRGAIDGPWRITNFHLARMGRVVYLEMRDPYAGGGMLACIDLDARTIRTERNDAVVAGCFQQSGRIEVIRSYQRVEAIAEADGTRVIRNVRPEPMTAWSVEPDGADERYIARVDLFGHHTILGGSELVQGTGQPPDRCIWLVEPGKPPQKIAEGPYFWHSGPSFDAEWIVADTSWPDEGIKLLHVPTRHWRTLCHARAEQDHAGVHPHPALSQDGRIAVFDSDRTGVPQVYVAHITEEFRESVKAGELDHPRPRSI